MKRLGLLAALVLVAAAGLKTAPALASGFEQITKNLTSVSKDQIIDGSAYLAGDSIAVDGTVKGDVYCAGKDIVINGTVEGDVLCAGQNITIDGTVVGNIRLAAMKAYVKGTVEGAATLAAMDITTDSASKIGRDAVVTGSQVNLAGQVGRDVMIGGEIATVSGVVGRNVEGSMSKLSFSSGAKVNGGVYYSSGIEANVPDGVVAGQVERTEPEKQTRQTSMDLSVAWAGILISIAAFVLATILLVVLLPRFAKRASDSKSFGELAKYFTVGLVTLVLAPFFIVMLFVSIIGFYVALLLALAILLIFMLGGILVAYRVGRFMLADKHNYVLMAAAGALTMSILGMIPVIGWAIALIGAIAGAGMILVDLMNQNFSKESKKETVLLAGKKRSTKKS